MSMRIFSVILFLICLLGIYHGLGITVDFSYEPVGPKPFPVGTLGIMACLAVVLFFFGVPEEIKWQGRLFYQKMAVFVFGFLLFAYGFEYIGFIGASTFLAFCVACIFGAKLKQAIFFAPCLSLALYFIFDYCLEVTLPIGLIFT